jgi:hypothetical protein
MSKIKEREYEIEKKISNVRGFYLFCKLLHAKELLCDEEYLDLITNDPLAIIEDIREGLYDNC